METSLKKKNPNQQKSPEQKCQDKLYQWSQSRHKIPDTITSNKLLKLLANSIFHILGKMKTEKNLQPHKHKPHKAENAQKHTRPEFKH